MSKQPKKDVPTIVITPGIFRLGQFIDRNGWKGQVKGVGRLDGERYYWLLQKDGTKAMVPASALEGEK